VKSKDARLGEGIAYLVVSEWVHRWLMDAIEKNEWATARTLCRVLGFVHYKGLVVQNELESEMEKKPNPKKGEPK